MQLTVDIELVGMLAYWFLLGKNMKYPIVLSIIGVAKILLNVNLYILRLFSKQKSSIIVSINKPSLQ